MKPVDFFIYHGLRSLSLLTTVLPEPLAMAGGGLLGRTFMRLSKRRRGICRSNLQRAGFDPALCHSVFERIGRLVITFLRMRHATSETLMENVDVVGFENYQQLRKRSERLILVTAHLGNWEKLAWAHSYLSGKPLLVVARAADQPGVDRFLREVRTAGGFAVLDKSRGVRAMLKELRKGEELGLLIDQKVKPGMGVPVPFFGELIPSVPVVSLLARATGAAIIPVFIGEEPDGRETIHYLPEVESTGDEVADTARLNALIEEYIRRYPEQWFWVHNRWRHATPIPESEPPADQK